MKLLQQRLYQTLSSNSYGCTFKSTWRHLRDTWCVSTRPEESGLPVTAVAILPEGTRQKCIPKGNPSLPPQSATRLSVPTAPPHFLPDARTVTWETEDGPGFFPSVAYRKRKQNRALCTIFTGISASPHAHSSRRRAASPMRAGVRQSDSPESIPPSPRRAHPGGTWRRCCCRSGPRCRWPQRPPASAPRWWPCPWRCSRRGPPGRSRSAGRPRRSRGHREAAARRSRYRRRSPPCGGARRRGECPHGPQRSPWASCPRSGRSPCCRSPCGCWAAPRRPCSPTPCTTPAPGRPRTAAAAPPAPPAPPPPAPAGRDAPWPGRPRRRHEKRAQVAPPPARSAPRPPRSAQGPAEPPGAEPARRGWWRAGGRARPPRPAACRERGGPVKVGGRGGDWGGLGACAVRPRQGLKICGEKTSEIIEFKLWSNAAMPLSVTSSLSLNIPPWAAQFNVLSLFLWRNSS